jgi:hypothetical protein|tara:strand:+ start:465 stop:1073 length:609 start_codon:yes stop_codon:yes gene_type:complete
MWALVESGNISKVIKNPKQITIGDTQYPSNIFSLWSISELKAIGIYEVVIDNTNLKDGDYYNNTNQTFTFASNQVTATYGTATAKPLDNVLYTADDETANANHVEGTVKQYGVRPRKIDKVNGEAYNLLQPNDWMVVKAKETGGSVASDWSTYRTGVRTAADNMKTKINAVSDVDALAALYVYNDATPPVRPLGEFPDAPSS